MGIESIDDIEAKHFDAMDALDAIDEGADLASEYARLLNRIYDFNITPEQAFNLFHKLKE